MLSKKKINSIKKKPQIVYYTQFRQSGRIEFRFKKEEKLYREDGSLAFNDTRYENYIPDLSIIKYTIYSGEANGILYKEEETLVYFIDDDYNYELKDIEECFDSRELAIDDFLQKTTNYVIESIQNLYIINGYASKGIEEKIEKFIKTLNENGVEARLIKGETNENKWVKEDC